MKNVLYTDASFAATLLVNEEQTGNDIIIVVDADATASQVLTVMSGTVVETYTITPSTENEIILPPELWNYGDVTELVLSKGGTDAGTIEIKFPEAIDTDASLYQTSAGHYSMQGGQSVQQQIVNLQTEVEDLFQQVIDYIHPSAISQDSIADGSNNTALEFEIYNNVADETVSFYSCFQFDISTTANTETDTYGDCTLTATLIKDGATVVTDVNTYGDGKKTLMLNYLLENMAKGNHTFALNLALSGGSLSQLQFISAYIMAMASIDDGNYEEEYDIDIDDDFAEYMELGGDDIIGDYIELEAPTGGSGNGQNFSGDQFCEDWLSAFVRPIEYAQIYDAKAGISPTYPSTDDPSEWADYMTSALMVGVKKLVPKFFDDQVYAQTGKHINVWFAGLQLDHPSNPNNRLMFGLWGVYMPSNVMFEIRENHPTQGYAVFDTGYKQGNIFYPVTTGSYNYLIVQYINGGFTENTGSNYLRPFILVYNVEAFKTYLNGLSAASIESLLQRSFFILANCNVKKERHQT